MNSLTAWLKFGEQMKIGIKYVSIKKRNSIMKINLSTLQKDLTEAYQLEFILSENLDQEIANFSDWLKKTIEKYSSKETKEKYQLEEFKPMIDFLKYSYLYHRYSYLEPIDELMFRSNYSAKQNFIANCKEDVWQNYDKSNYEKALKEDEVFNQHASIYYKLIQERKIYIGRWSRLDLISFIFKEAEINWMDSNGENKPIINPPIGRFILNKNLQESLNQLIKSNGLLDWKDQSPLEIESNFNNSIDILLNTIIGQIKNFINAEIDDLLKKILKFLKAEDIKENGISIINLGTKITENHSRNNFNYFDQYSIKLANKEYTFSKKVENFAQESKIASIFIIDEKQIIHLIISPEKLIERSEYIIKKDVKKLNIANDNILEIHYHGHFSPDSIVLENYESALKLQKFISDKR
jgi:hypothetical protein